MLIKNSFITYSYKSDISIIINPLSSYWGIPEKSKLFSIKSTYNHFGRFLSADMLIWSWSNFKNFIIFLIVPDYSFVSSFAFIDFIFFLFIWIASPYDGDNREIFTIPLAYAKIFSLSNCLSY